MYRALYRKWRPADFDQVCGQEQVTHVLKYQVGTDKISHAYLFCGSRGTGKTSCAKIFAKAVNCQNPKDGNPCHECESCRAIESGTAVDVVEMDAASNNGVDNVREMIEELSFTPARFRFRVYIIDEVHMMSPSAFNALLKTLEEPPAHVVFILATTELQKLPATVISRCQRFDFRRLSSRVIADRLAYIAQQEGVVAAPEALRIIARMAKGGMRDAISLFELCASADAEITAEHAVSVLGAGSRDELFDLLDAIVDRDYATVYRTVEEVVMRGYDVGLFLQNVSDLYRDLLVVSVLKDAADYLDLTDHEYERSRALVSRLSVATLMAHSRQLEKTLTLLQMQGVSKRSMVELALVRLCDGKLSADPDALLARIETLEKEVATLRLTGAPAPAAEKPAPLPKPVSAPAKEPPPAPESPAPSAAAPVKGWREVVARFEELKPAYKGILRGAVAQITAGGVLCITLGGDFLGGVFMNDATSVRMLLSLVCEADPSCDSTKEVQFRRAGTARAAQDTFTF